MAAEPRLAAAATRPEIPPAAGPTIESPFPLSHLGVRWVGSEEAAVDIRLAGSDGVWGPWRALPADHDLEDGDGGPVMSELIRAHGATRAQVRAAGDARDVEILAIDTLEGPRSRKVATGTPARAAEKPPSDGGDEGDDRGADAASSSTTTTVKGSSTTGKGSSTTTTTGKPKPQAAQPSIITRSEWGADESIRKNQQKYAPITKLFVHHTVTSPDGADPDPAATVRAIYAYHVQGNGWDDIGYNFLVDAEGRVYEGRWARDYASGEKPTGEDLNDNGVVGAHVLNHNAGSAGVAMLGDFSGGEPTTAARDSLVKLMAWKADRHDIDVLGNDPFQASDGVVSTFPNLGGHRDAGQTSAPATAPSAAARYPAAGGLAGDRRPRRHPVATGRPPPTAGCCRFGDAPALGSMAGTVLNGLLSSGWRPPRPARATGCSVPRWRRLLVRRRGLLRLHRQHQAEQAGGGHGAHPDRQGLLVRGHRRRDLLLR